MTASEEASLATTELVTADVTRSCEGSATSSTSTSLDEYVLRSDLKDVTPDAIDVSDVDEAQRVASEAEAERQISAMEQERIGVEPLVPPGPTPPASSRERRLPSEAWARLPGFWTGLMAASMCSFDLRSPATAAHASLVTVALAVSCSSRSVPWSSTGGSLSRSHGHDGFHESLSIGEFKMEPMLDIDRSFGGIRTGRIPATTSTFRWVRRW